MFLKSDLIRILKNKWIIISGLFLLFIMVADPISVFYKVVRLGFYDNMYHHWLLFNASANFGGDIFNALFYVFPVIFTGMIYFYEDKTSIKKMLLVRGRSRKRYYVSKYIVIFACVFVWMLVVLLLNVFITSLLFTHNIAGIDPIFIPSEKSFAHQLFVIDPIYVCIFYSVMNALILTLLTVLCVGLHMVIKFPNVYIALIVPVVVMFVANYILDSLPYLRSYSINLNRQPAASYAMNAEFTFEKFFLSVGILAIVDVVLLIVGIIKNRNVM